MQALTTCIMSTWQTHVPPLNGTSFRQHHEHTFHEAVSRRLLRVTE